MNRLSTLGILLACAVGCSAPPTPDVPWTEQLLVDAPEGMTDAVDCLVVAPDAPDLVYVAGNAGEQHLEAQPVHPFFLSSDDGGRSWRSQQPALGSRTVTTLGVGATRDGQRTLFAGSGAGLHRSRDGGQSWEDLSDGLPGEFQAFALSVLPGPGERVVAVDFSGAVFCSEDAGATWTRGAGARGLPAALAADANRALLLTDEGLFQSADGGRSWQQLADCAGVPGYAAIALSPADPAQILVVAKLPDGSSQVLRSVDRGATWAPVPGSEGAQDVEVDPADPQRLYVLNEHEGASVWRTRDGGATWEPLGAVSGAWELVLGGGRLYALDRLSRRLHVLELKQLAD
ncbi:MAG: hypothetical protein KDD82_28035 [Planctomycetes bacterium]|nr:hypothetical protein [Planctomycetota bacterium]